MNTRSGASGTVDEIPTKKTPDISNNEGIVADGGFDFAWVQGDCLHVLEVFAWSMLLRPIVNKTLKSFELQ